MVRFRGSPVLGAVVALSAGLLSVAPALAQTAASGSGSASGASMQLGDKAPDGGLMKTHGSWRASGLVGATVYNDQGERIGAIDDLLLSSDGTVQNAVVSVGGFLGIGSKLVEVPFKNIKFAPSKTNPASGATMAKRATGPVNTMAATTPANGAGATGTAGVQAPADTAGTGASPAPGLDSASATGSGGAAPATPVGTSDEYSLVLPGATKASLTSDHAYEF